MKSISFISSIFITFLVLTSCSIPVRVNEYDKSNLSNIKNWHLTFTYITGSIEERTTAAGKKETTVKKAQYAENLQLIDDIYFNLKNRNFPISKVNRKGYGVIQIHPILHYDIYRTYFKSIDVRINDYNDNLIYRVNIKNEIWAGPGKEDNDSIAKITANKIYSLLSKAKNK